MRLAGCIAGLTAFLALQTGSLPAHAVDLARHFARHDVRATAAVDHAAWDRLLSRHVRPDQAGLHRVDYRRFKAEGRDALRGYLDRLQAVAVSRLNRAEQLAYWINLYNAKTVDIVLAHYPVGSIRDISISGLFAIGPWGRKVMQVEGVELSLDDIEHKIMRPLWRDPRIHYAANCASVGCPNLARVAYTSAALEAMLESAAKDYVNSPRGVSARNGAVAVSKIYSWYMEDFGGSEAGVLEHLRRYASPELARRLEAVTRIAGYEYDWRLNDTAGE